MFHFSRKREVLIGSPVKGKTVLISEVSDPTFGEEILGKGIAVNPDGGSIVAPADGVIDMMFETLHAFSMTTVDGIELLVHVGLETVSLKGKTFKAFVETGSNVKKGDLVLEVDWDAIKSAGFDTITPMVICNTDDYDKIEPLVQKEVLGGDDILKVVLK